MEVDKLGDLQPVLDHAKRAAAPESPADSLWLPYLGETLDAGVPPSSPKRSSRPSASPAASSRRDPSRPAGSGRRPASPPGRAQRVNGGGGYAQRPHRRHPAARLGHPARRRPHARLRGHRRLRRSQRGRRQDRPRAAEAQHPDLPLRQRQRAQHHPSAAWKRASSWATTPTSCPSAPTPSRPSTPSASPPARPSPSAA